MSVRSKLHEVIFEADTPKGRFFDISLIFCILTSIVVIMLDSVESMSEKYGELFRILEWTFTALFTIEYILRIISMKRASSYVFSFYGIIDFFSIVPTYLSILLPGSQYLLSIRFLRILRIFRVLKLMQFVSEASVMAKSMRQSLPKVSVFLLSIFILVTIFGAVMYMVEGKENGFDSIPHAIYWAVVTLSTVGYGDITPQTPLGQGISAIIMVLGYGTIAVPTGIVTAELTKNAMSRTNTQACPVCGLARHDDDASFCKACGESLLN
jgi:voltage-gated potassium channel